MAPELDRASIARIERAALHQLRGGAPEDYEDSFGGSEPIMVDDKRDLHAVRKEVRPLRNSGGFFDLLMGQKADGSWEITDDLAMACKYGRDHLEAVAAQCAEPWAANALATLLILALVEQTPVRNAYDTILEKGRTWLAYTTAVATPPKSHPTWEAWAKQALNV